jgi:hypothetical protein
MVVSTSRPPMAVSITSKTSMERGPQRAIASRSGTKSTKKPPSSRSA